VSLFSKLFGGGRPAQKPVDYKGFQIFPDPIKENGAYRLAARIEKELAGERRSHRLIRADTFQSAEAAGDAAIGKARQVIDEQGDGLLG
jgi:hypothetical protein